MTSFDVEVERLPADDQLRAALATLFGCGQNDVLVVHEDFGSVERPVSCAVFKRSGGQFAAMLSVSAMDPFAATLSSRSLLENGASLAKLLQISVVVSNDDSANPYSMILIDSAGEAAIADVSDEALDEEDNIEIRRLGPFGPIMRLARADIVAMLLENGICREKDIAGFDANEVAAIELAIGYHLPWQFREFLLSIGVGAGDFLRAEGGFFSGRRQAAELLQRLGKAQPDLQPLVDALLQGRGVFPLSVSADSFRFFNLGETQDPVIHEWTSGMSWPRPTWPTLSGFLVASARHFLSGHDNGDFSPG